jgi:hypothetical protein
MTAKQNKTKQETREPKPDIEDQDSAHHSSVLERYATHPNNNAVTNGT